MRPRSCPPIWVTRSGTLLGRLHYTAVTVAALAVVWVLAYWNLLGWRY